MEENTLSDSDFTCGYCGREFPVVSLARWHEQVHEAEDE